MLHTKAGQIHLNDVRFVKPQIRRKSQLILCFALSDNHECLRSGLFPERSN